MKIYPLCSSYISDGRTAILVDIGIGIRCFSNQLALAGLSPESLRAVFITHEHSDHIKGLSAFCKKYNLPVYASRGTLENLVMQGLLSDAYELREINKKTADIDSIHVSAFHTSHDSAESLGFRITFDDGKTAAVCTDLGFVSSTVSEHLTGCDMVLLESNYDEQMLTYGPYPAYLKRRIAGIFGHLSNEDCSNEVMRLLENGTRHFLLGHLSEENNRPEVAYSHTISKLTYRGFCLGKDYTLEIAPRTNVGKVLEY